MVCGKHIFPEMAILPYNYDSKLAFQSEFGLRVHWFGRYAGYPSWSVAPCRLAPDMINFFFIEKSSCWVILNGRKWVLNEGDLMVVWGGDESSCGHNPEKPHVSLSASLALQQGSEVNTLLQRKFNRLYRWHNPAEFTEEFNKVLFTFASASKWRDLEIAGALIHWLSYIMSHLRAPLGRLTGRGGGTVDTILAAEAWANSRLQQPVTLAEWAGAVGLNPIIFGRLFKRETGHTPMEWLNERRLQMASQYLSGTHKSVGEIAEDCGFPDQFYFSRVFRQHYGQSPLRYRQGLAERSVRS